MGKSKCTPEYRNGRKKMAVDFLNSADALGIVVDTPDGSHSYVQLCVLAGIAASDVICCANLGYHNQGDNHDEAIAMLHSVDKQLAKHLGVLLKMKTRTGYQHREAIQEDRKRAGRAAAALVEAAKKY